MSVTDEVLNNGTLVKDVHPSNILRMFSTEEVSNNATFVNAVHSVNILPASVTSEVSPAAIKDTRLLLSLNALRNA